MWTPASARKSTNSNGTKNLEEGNKAYAATFTQGHLALPPSQKYAVCEYCRLDLVPVSLLTEF